MSKICSKCGTTLADTEEFCHECGEPQPKSTTPDYNSQQNVNTNYTQPQQQSYNNPASNYYPPQQPYSNPTTNYPPQQQPYSTPYPQTVVYNTSMEDNYHTGIGGWIGWLLLITLLPFIGLIIAALCARDKSVKSWAAAQLVLELIFVAIIVILIFSAPSCIGTMTHSFSRFY